MKRTFLAIAAIVIVVVGFASLAQAVTINGERQVGVSKYTVRPVKVYTAPAATTYTTPAAPDASKKMLKAINSNSAMVKRLEKSTNALTEGQKTLMEGQKTLVEEQRNTQSAVTTLAGNVGTLAEATENVAKKADLADKNAKVANTNVVAFGKAILDSGATNTWILGIIGVLGFGIIAALIICFGSRNENSMTTKTVKVLQAIEKVPEKTVDEIKAREFDPAPFEFDVAGKHVVYTFPVDDKCYRTLKVEDTNGSSNPADFDQQTLTSWYQTKNYVKGTMKKFFEGKLAGTSEEALINHLVNVTKEIKIS